MTTISTSVISIESLTPYVLKMVLDAGKSLEYKAGQYLQVVMSANDKRPFSIANMPSTDGLIELHIGAVPENPHAYEVVEKARKDNQLDIEVGLGNAYLRANDKNAILIAGGTGYSYTKSILLTLLNEQPNREVLLYWGAKKPEDLYEMEELLQLSVVHKNFSFIPVVEDAPTDWEYKVGLVHEAVMKDFSNLSNTQVYVAGRFEMAAVVKEAFLPLSLDKDDLFGDAFAFI